MSSWSDFREAAGDRMETAARVVEGVIQGGGDALADVVETAGHAAQDGLAAAGAAAGPLPGAGRFLRGAATWTGGLVAGVAGLAGAAIKGAFGIAAGASGGVLGLLGGALLLRRDLVLGGLVDLGASIAGAVLLVAGTLAALIQRVLFLQSPARALSAGEKAMLRRVFLRSMSLYNVRLVEGRAGLFGFNSRPFTLGNTIYLKEYLASLPGLLIHECVHAWQYQGIGPRYAIDALSAQTLLPDAYDWAGELGRGRRVWGRFNKEAQAELIEDTWLGGTLTAGGSTRTGDGAFFELGGGDGGDAGTVAFSSQGTDHTALAVSAAATLRGRISARWSKRL